MRIYTYHLINLIDYASLRGIDQTMISKLLSDQTLIQNDQSTDIADFYIVLDYLHQKTADDMLGIRMGNFLNLKSLGLIHEISLHASTIQEMVYYLKNYIETTFSLVKITAKIQTHLLNIETEINNDNHTLNRIILENVLTVLSRELSLIVSKGSNLSISSPYYTANYPSDWKKGPKFKISLKSTALKTQLKILNSWHLDLLIPEYLKFINSLQADLSFSQKVTKAILSLAKPELPDVRQVADTFNMTVRTLQRKLKVEGTSCREINSDLKKQICVLLLQHDQFSINDISIILGFSELASFYHAFKKWYTQTPESFRNMLNRREDF